MLSVSVQKDIGEIQPKIVGPLTGRNLFSCIAAIGIAILISCYCYFLLHLKIDICMFIVIIVSMPIWAVGFWHPYKMNFEEFFPLWIKFTFENNLVSYISSDNLDGFDWTSPAVRQTKEREKVVGSKTDKVYDMIKNRPDSEAINLDLNTGFYVKNSVSPTCAEPFINHKVKKNLDATKLVVTGTQIH